jgi:Fur family ferric uptake transcriptional regulator
MSPSTISLSPAGKARWEDVVRIFSNHLEEHKLRRTPERFAILEEIYNRSDHFDAEALYLHMKNSSYRVSRATVYNTLELLIQCDLITKHQFGKNLTQYEKSYGFKQHDHLICVECGKVIEFCDPRIQQIKSTMAELLSFNIHSHDLNLYGTCSECCDKQEK